MKKFPFLLSAALIGVSANLALGQNALAVASGVKVGVGDNIGSADKQEWAFKISAGYDVKTGNSETEAYNGHFEAVRSYSSADFRFEIDGAYAEQTTEETIVETVLNDDGSTTERERTVKSDDRTAGNVKGKIEFKYLLDDNFIYTDVSALHDAEADLNYRFMESIGLGRYLIKEDELTLSMQLGLAYVQEDLGESDNYLGYRVAERLDWKPDFADGVSFYESGEAILDSDDTDRYLANVEAGIDIPVFANLSVTFKAVYNYNSEPATDKESADTQFITQLSYRF